MSRNNNPYVSQFNQVSQYNIVPSGNISVIPYIQSKVNDSAAVETREYTNKFFNEEVYKEGEPPITLTADELENIRRDRLRKHTNIGNVYTQTYISYVNIDSSQRERLPNNVYAQELYSLPAFPIYFTNASSIISIYSPCHTFVKDNRIVLNNIISKNVILQNVVMVKKNSLFMRIFQKNHGLSLYGLYDQSDPNEFQEINYVDNLPTSFNESDNIPDGVNQYYILKKNATIDITIQLSNIKGCDISRTLIGNIPINYINRRQTVYLLFTKNDIIFVQDQNSYLIILDQESSINYMDGVSYITGINGESTGIVATNMAYIKFFNLFGIPLNYLNSGTPINSDRKYPYFTVIDTTKDTFTIDVNYPAIVDPKISFYNYTDILNGQNENVINITELVGTNRGGGTQCYARLIVNITLGNPNPNNYLIALDRDYKNIIQVRIVSSIFPKSQYNVNNSDNIVNNRLYWRNLNDGNWIYYLEIVPGIYSIPQLENAITDAFNNTIRYQYTIEYSNQNYPSIVTRSTPTNDIKYDDNGYYKYHLVNVSISEITNIVTFSSFRQIIQQDKPGNYNVIVIPDYTIEFTMAENLGINFGNVGGTGIVPQNITPFNPEVDILYIYFTKNSQLRINETFPFSYGNLYKFVQYIGSSATTPGTNTIQVNLESSVALLANFYRNKGQYPEIISTQEINSVNTPTLLTNFTYNYLTEVVFMPNHLLKIGDLIITDLFINPSFANQIFVYEITNVIDNDNFMVVRYDHGDKYKFIYDSLIINFNKTPSNPTDAYYWLDQKPASVPVDQPPPSPPNHNTLSFTNINPTPENKKIMRVQQPNHQLNVGDVITIANSSAINNVPADAINKSHTINRILDANHYEVLLDIYIPIMANELQVETFNIILITYPDTFQMFFNFQDTLGNLLSFNKVGEPVAITSYGHIIKNTEPYANDYNYDTLGADFEQGLKKLNFERYNYFYISSPELGHYRNTKPVANVFAKIRWFNDQGQTVFDSFVPTVKYFNPVLAYLSEINFAMYNPDGTLVDFNGLDHSFTIEITEVYNQPENTDVSVRINSALIVRRV